MFFWPTLENTIFFVSSALFHSASLHKRCKKTVQTAFEDNLCFISAPHYRSATWLSDLQWTFWEPWTPWFLFLPHTPRHHRHLMTSQSEIRQLVAATLQRNRRRISWPLPQRRLRALSSCAESRLETNPKDIIMHRFRTNWKQENYVIKTNHYHFLFQTTCCLVRFTLQIL